MNTTAKNDTVFEEEEEFDSDEYWPAEWEIGFPEAISQLLSIDFLHVGSFQELGKHYMHFDTENPAFLREVHNDDRSVKQYLERNWLGDILERMNEDNLRLMVTDVPELASIALPMVRSGKHVYVIEQVKPSNPYFQHAWNTAREVLFMVERPIDIVSEWALFRFGPASRGLSVARNTEMHIAWWDWRTGKLGMHGTLVRDGTRYMETVRESAYSRDY